MKQLHIHGGDPKNDLNRFTLPDIPVLDFSVNLNPLGPPEEIEKAWGGLFDIVRAYPSIEGEGIGAYYHNRFDIPYANILAGNGSTELIYLIPRVLGFKNVLIFTPSFFDYARASEIAGAKITPHGLLPQEGFGFPDFETMGRLMRNVDAVWIGRPNNPTGNLTPKKDILDMADRFPDKWFIIDEAFIQFVEDWNSRSLLYEPLRPNILILQSLTKFYALAGLRMGAVIAREEAITRLKYAKEPWTVNSIADRICPMLVDVAAYESVSNLIIQNERKRIYQRLDETTAVKAFPGVANFMLCRWRKTKDLDDLLKHLLKNGIYIRDCRNFPGLEDNYFRFCIGRPEDNDRLLQALASC